MTSLLIVFVNVKYEAFLKPPMGAAVACHNKLSIILVRSSAQPAIVRGPIILLYCCTRISSTAVTKDISKSYGSYSGMSIWPSFTGRECINRAVQLSYLVALYHLRSIGQLVSNNSTSIIQNTGRKSPNVPTSSVIAPLRTASPFSTPVLPSCFFFSARGTTAPSLTSPFPPSRSPTSPTPRAPVVTRSCFDVSGPNALLSNPTRARQSTALPAARRSRHGVPNSRLLINRRPSSRTLSGSGGSGDDASPRQWWWSSRATQQPGSA